MLLPLSQIDSSTLTWVFFKKTRISTKLMVKYNLFFNLRFSTFGFFKSL